jgi:hypothetical protein
VQRCRKRRRFGGAEASEEGRIGGVTALENVREEVRNILCFLKNIEFDMWQNMMHMINLMDNICPKLHDFEITKSSKPSPCQL